MTTTNIPESARADNLEALKRQLAEAQAQLRAAQERAANQTVVEYKEGWTKPNSSGKSYFWNNVTVTGKGLGRFGVKISSPEGLVTLANAIDEIKRVFDDRAVCFKAHYVKPTCPYPHAGN